MSSIYKEELIRDAVYKNQDIQKRFSVSLNDNSEDAISVYVRIKPDETSQNVDFLTYDEEQNTVILKKKTVEQLFKFTHVFKPETTQEDIFEKCVKPCLNRLFDGQSAFLFTYGPSNSGKTFTIQGERGKPGLVPRMLVSLFSSLHNFMDDQSPLCPERGCSIIALSEADIVKKIAYKKTLLGIAKYMLPQMAKRDTFISLSELKGLDSCNLSIKEDRGVYALWISFYEIYNEKVYDLFGDPKETQKPLRLMTDKDSTIFIKGLNVIQVSSLEEAILLYSLGRFNLSINSTAVNDRSSRSHSIFTVKLVGRPPNNVSSYFLATSYSICDLAGMERAHKTKNEGLRLREAQQINSSFLVLNRCLRIIRENQNLKIKKHIPYRESKLTQILGPSLTSRDTSLSMVVTISQNGLFIEETEGCLKSSSVAISLKALPPPPPVRPYKRGRFSVAVSKCLPGKGVDWQAIAINENKDSEDKIKSECTPDVYKELDEERKQRIAVEEKMKQLKAKHRQEIDDLQLQLLKSPIKKDITQLKRMLEEQEEEFMAAKAESLKLKKDIMVLKEELEKNYSKMKLLEQTNDIYKEMLDDAKDNVEMLQDHIYELEEVMKSKDSMVLEKDEKIEYLEKEKLKIEDAFIAHVNECEKTITGLEDKLQKQEQNYDSIFRKYQDVRKELYDAQKGREQIELDLKNYQKQFTKLEYENNGYKRHIDTLENQLKTFEANKCDLMRRYEILLENKQKSQENKPEITDKENIPEVKETPLKLQRAKAPRIFVGADSDDDIHTSGTKQKKPLRTRSEDRRVACSDLELTGDPSFLMPSDRKSKTASKKKKPRSKKYQNYPEYLTASSDKSENSNTTTTPFESSTARSRRKLFIRSSSDLTNSGESNTCAVNMTQSQPSPITLLRTLRTGKKY